jgi:hypothetical protein
MIEDRSPASPEMAPPASPGAPGSLQASSVGDPLADPRALQILSTEHWSLLAARSLAYNEAFSRAGMFLSFFAASLIVMGFLLSSTTYGQAVEPVVALLLLADAYVGAATVGRLLSASGEELETVRGMNRIRNAYLQIVPGLEPYFVTGFHDDAEGVLASYGGIRRTGLGHFLHSFTTAIGLVATIESFVIGAFVTVVVLGFGASYTVAIGLGVAVTILGFAVFAVVGVRAALGRQRAARSLFPTPPTD